MTDGDGDRITKHPGIADAPEPLVDGPVSANTLRLLDYCERRLWLWTFRREESASPTEFDRFLMERGKAHEAEVLKHFPGAVGPVWRHDQPLEPAIKETRRLLADTRNTLYQPALSSGDGLRLGIPDFIAWRGEALVVIDAKTAVNITKNDHPEVLVQLTHYHRILRDTYFDREVRLEVVNGRGETVAVEPLPDETYESAYAEAVRLTKVNIEPDLLRGHSTCQKCGFYRHCWDRAIAERRVEVLSEVTSRTLPRLKALGIRTIEDLSKQTPSQLRGPGLQTVAEKMVEEARAHRDNEPRWLKPPEIPRDYPIVLLDLEGDPEGEEVDNAIYLWGLILDRGDGEAVPEAILADFGADGDREAWERFVARATEIMRQHPEARWLHWHHYEKTWLKKYAQKYGAPAGFMDQLTALLLDLHAATRDCVRLPLFSYSLKKVAPFVGFKWRNEAAGSLWSIVRYSEARLTKDPAERKRILDEVIDYNSDDNLGTRAVWQWLVREGKAGGTPA